MEYSKNTYTNLIYSNGDPLHNEVFIQATPVVCHGIPARKTHFLLKFSRISALIGITILFLLYYPAINKLVSDKSTDNGVEVSAVLTPDEERYLPKYDPSLPEQNTITIPSVKIETVINESLPEYHEDALRKGIWRVSDFGDPDSYDTPTILVAHRYGYLSWTIPYRLKNSFYNLPKTKIGDTVEIVWMQRKYTYVIYATGEGEEVADYSADLILYTCISLNSEEKIFRYAKLLEI